MFEGFSKSRRAAAWTQYILFAIFGLILLILLPPILTPMLGGVFGAYATYVATAIVLMLLYWISRKTEKF